MGTFAIDAATATDAQVASALGISDAAAWSKVAVTPMIGVNDTSDEIFTVANAQQLAHVRGQQAPGLAVHVVGRPGHRVPRRRGQLRRSRPAAASSRHRTRSWPRSARTEPDEGTAAMNISRRTMLAGSAAAAGRAAAGQPARLTANGQLCRCVRWPTQAASQTAATVAMSIQNNTGSDTVYAFVTGQAIDNGNALMLLEADGQTPYYPASPSATGSPLAVDCAIPLNAPGGAPVTITVPHLAGARLWFSIGTPADVPAQPRARAGRAVRHQPVRPEHRPAVGLLRVHLQRCRAVRQHHVRRLRVHPGRAHPDRHRRGTSRPPRACPRAGWTWCAPG